MCIFFPAKHPPPPLLIFCSSFRLFFSFVSPTLCSLLADAVRAAARLELAAVALLVDAPAAAVLALGPDVAVVADNDGRVGVLVVEVARLPAVVVAAALALAELDGGGGGGERGDDGEELQGCAGVGGWLW